MKSLFVCAFFCCLMVLLASVVPRSNGHRTHLDSQGISLSSNRGAKSLVDWHRSYFEGKSILSAMYPAKSKVIQKFEPTVRKAALGNQLDPELVWSIIVAESGLKEHAISPRGAMGLMQLMPPTAKEVGVTDIFNPHQNILGGVRYFKRMLDRFDGNVAFALAAYNAGPARVEKYKGIPPYRETKQYVSKVLSTYAELKDAKRANRSA